MDSKAIRTLGILCVDDCPDTRELIVDFLKDVVKMEHLFTARNSRKGLSLYLQHKPDMVICHITRPYWHGLEMVQEIREKNKTVPIIFITDFHNKQLLSKWLNDREIAIIEKPVFLRQVYSAMESFVPQILDSRKEKYFPTFFIEPF